MAKARPSSGIKTSQPVSGSVKKLQLSSNHGPRTLLHLRKGDAAILDRINLPLDDARRLMELGFLPGTVVTAGQSAPGGDPQVYQVDGSEIALRRETAAKLIIKSDSYGRVKRRAT